jgi:hypothetical protein
MRKAFAGRLDGTKDDDCEVVEEDEDFDSNFRLHLDDDDSDALEFDACLDDESSDCTVDSFVLNLNSKTMNDGVNKNLKR